MGFPDPRRHLTLLVVGLCLLVTVLTACENDSTELVDADASDTDVVEQDTRTIIPETCLICQEWVQQGSDALVRSWAQCNQLVASPVIEDGQCTTTSPEFAGFRRPCQPITDGCEPTGNTCGRCTEGAWRVCDRADGGECQFFQVGTPDHLNDGGPCVSYVDRDDC